jgi:hypothetical protein
MLLANMLAATLRISVVLDRGVAPQLANLEVVGQPTIDNVRMVAAHLRMMRPAWREISLIAGRGLVTQSAQAAFERPTGECIRLDLVVTSREPLVVADAYSAKDAGAKIEALSYAFVGNVSRCDMHVYPTDVGIDPDLFPMSGWRSHWYCTCGEISLDAIKTCPKCGRARPW